MSLKPMSLKPITKAVVCVFITGLLEIQLIDGHQHRSQDCQFDREMTLPLSAAGHQEIDFKIGILRDMDSLALLPGKIYPFFPLKSFEGLWAFFFATVANRSPIVIALPCLSSLCLSVVFRVVYCGQTMQSMPMCVSRIEMMGQHFNWYHFRLRTPTLAMLTTTTTLWLLRAHLAVGWSTISVAFSLTPAGVASSLV